MPVQWTTDLAVGICEIDAQHRDVFDKADELVLALSFAGEPDEPHRDRIENALAALADCVVRHFATEEKYMTRLRCPDYSTHRDQHESLVDELVKIKTSIDRRIPPADCASSVAERVIGWFAVHIPEFDRKLAKFLNEKLAAA